MVGFSRAVLKVGGSYRDKRPRVLPQAHPEFALLYNGSVINCLLEPCPIHPRPMTKDTKIRSNPPHLKFNMWFHNLLVQLLLEGSNLFFVCVSSIRIHRPWFALIFSDAENAFAYLQIWFGLFIFFFFRWGVIILTYLPHLSSSNELTFL